jgi:hypothetical protein
MRCRLSVNLETDRPYWVTASSFLNNFDQNDFQNREVLDVADVYLESYFDIDNDGSTCFLLPPVGVHRGRTEFISGRHRTAVLLNHLQRVPLSFDTRALSDSDSSWIDSVVEQIIDLDDYVELPDLPIKAALP